MLLLLLLLLLVLLVLLPLFLVRPPLSRHRRGESP